MTAPEEWRENQIVEVLPNGYLLELFGGATGRAHDGLIEASGTGTLLYGAAGCTSGDLRLTFTPR